MMANDTQMRKILKKNRKKRIELLKELAKKIESGEYLLKDIDPNKLYLLQDHVRREYEAPRERSSYNYGYMTDGEAADLASPKIDPNM